MNCKVCNTRLGGGDTNCPNCGSSVGAALLGKSDSHRPRPIAPLRSSAAIAEAELLDSPEDEAQQALEKAGLAEPKRERSPAPRAAPRGPSSGVRELLAARPEALERSLEIYRDEAGVSTGLGYRSPVGEIDLLARDGTGALVVVMIGEHHRAEELVAEILQRMGWVRKHIGSGKSKVRGIVLVDEAPEHLSYAAAAVADTVSFLTYRAALEFEPIEL